MLSMLAIDPTIVFVHLNDQELAERFAKYNGASINGKSNPRTG
jgi:hypothetical protein